MTSGLAAAFSDQAPAMNLGALESETLSLASVDGLETGAPIMPDSSFAPPAFAPPSVDDEPTRQIPPSKPKDVPLDLFEPPDMDGQQLVVELAADELEHQARKRAATPAAVPVVAPPSPELRRSQPSLAAPSPGATPASHGATPRWRLAAGVAVAIVLGFVPAHVVASVREGSLREIDHEVEKQQAAADTPATYAALDVFREAQLDRKKSHQRSIALTSMLIWAILAGGLGYVWFRRIPWERLPLPRWR